MTRIALGALVALCVILVVRDCHGSAALDLAQAAVAEKDTAYWAAKDSLEGARALADTLAAHAARRDSTLAHVVDTVEVIVRSSTAAAAVADSSFASRSDSLRFRLETLGDSIGVRLLEGIVADHAEGRRGNLRIIEAQRTELVETRAWGEAWRTTAIARHVALLEAGEALEAAESSLRARDVVIDGLEDELAQKERQAWYERGAVLAAAAVLVLR